MPNRDGHHTPPWKHGVLITRLTGKSPGELFEISKSKSMF